MNKFWKIIQYGYLVVAAVCLIEGFISLKGNGDKVYLYFGFAIVFIFLFFVKRKFRQKIEKRNNSKPQ